MASNSINVSAPGSLMLFGEHAVLEGHHAMTCAIDRRLHVRLTPRRDRQITITSALGQIETSLEEIEPTPPLHYVLELLRREAPDVPGGLDLHIESKIDPTVGLGSSAAVLAATAGALDLWRERPLDPAVLLPRCRDVVWHLQGIGSGADLAASLYGGILLYRMDPLSVEPLHRTLPLSLVYVGYKEPTPRVIQRVQALRKEHPEAFDHIYQAMDWIVLEARLGVIAQNLEVLGELANMHQGLLDAVGVNNKDLSSILHALRQRPGVTGAKISGSGLGDCVVGFGHAPPGAGEPGHPVSVTMDPEGIRHDPL